MIRRYVIHIIYIPEHKVKVIWGHMSNYMHFFQKRTKANFTKLHNVKHHERVCFAQDTGSHTLGQDLSQRSQVKLFNYVPMNTLIVLNVTEK